MPFMKGQAALRRTINFLEKGQLRLRENVRIMAFAYNPGPEYPNHDGLHKFVFWHLPQLKYQNEIVQMVTFKMMTPSPWIQAYMEDKSKVLIDCDSHSREEIYDHVKAILGKPEEELMEEKLAADSHLRNNANFGSSYNRQCICEIPGQVPCPGWQPLPKEMTGKWKSRRKDDDDE